MILLHNTATLLQPRYCIFNLFKWLWKCQDNPFALDKADIMDFRIYFDRKGMIRFAHGLVTLSKQVYTTEQFKREFCGEYHPKIRIMLERGANETNIQRFKDLVESIDNTLVIATIKKTGEIIRNDFKGVSFIGLNYEYWIHGNSLSWNLKRLWSNGLMTMRKYAKLHNDEITDEMRKDESVVYEIDFY